MNKDEPALLAEFQRRVEQTTDLGPTITTLTAVDRDPTALMRFLRAREGNVEAAYKMWRKWCLWRREFGVDDGGITEASVQSEVNSGKAVWYGFDKVGRACCVVRPRFHDPKATTADAVIRFSVFMMEKGIRLATEHKEEQLLLKNGMIGSPSEQMGIGDQNLCLIYDRTGMTMSNFDTKLFGVARRMADMLQDYYAERLGAMYVLGVNWFYWAIWKVISPLLSQKTRNKIHILKSPDDLLRYFDPSQLQEEYRQQLKEPVLLPLTT